MYEIKWEEEALKEIGKLPRTISSRIFKKVEALGNNRSVDIKKLKNDEKFRLRVGDYRIIFSIETNLIVIWKVGHRRNIYKKQN